VAKELGMTLSELRSRMTDTELLGWKKPNAAANPAAFNAYTK
jgi:hypothetical protein